MKHKWIVITCILFLMIIIFVIGFISGAESTANMIRQAVNLDTLCLLR